MTCGERRQHPARAHSSLLPAPPRRPSPTHCLHLVSWALPPQRQPREAECSLGVRPPTPGQGLGRTSHPEGGHLPNGPQKPAWEGRAEQRNWADTQKGRQPWTTQAFWRATQARHLGVAQRHGRLSPDVGNPHAYRCQSKTPPLSFLHQTMAQPWAPATMWETRPVLGAPGFSCFRHLGREAGEGRHRSLTRSPPTSFPTTQPLK